MTIDVDFIAQLLDENPNDLLFIADFSAEAQALLGVDLPPFDPTDSTKLAFEDPFLMTTRGLILENIPGLELVPDGDDNHLLNPPVFRGVPALFNLEFTAPYGYNGNIVTLQDFAMGAVIQHFPKTLDRIEGVDFVLPTAAELAAMEAFMLSNTSPANGNFKIEGPRSLLSIPEDKKAQDTTRPEVRGRELLFSVGCTSCHGGPVFDGGNRATGVEDLAISKTLPTRDIGAGSDFFPQFRTPQLFGLRRPAVFHNNAVGDNTAPIEGKTLRFAKLRAAVAFYNSEEFADADNSPGGLNMIEQEIDDIAAFLEAISVP